MSFYYDGTTEAKVVFKFVNVTISVPHQVSKMFENKEFCVVSGHSKLPKDEIERKIAEVSEPFSQIGLLIVSG